jgi:hypothetical protein
MPIHDWSRIAEGTFHYFRQRWVQALAEAFNMGGLPPEFFAMTEFGNYGDGTSGYATRADRVTVNRTETEVVAVVEVLSLGNKSSAKAVGGFARAVGAAISQGIHVLVIDLFAPSEWDSHGIHSAIWGAFDSGPPFQLPATEPLTVVSYEAGQTPTAYLEPMRLGQLLPDMPLFLTPGHYVTCPLEATYQETWRVFPQHLRTRIENPPAG